MDSIELSSLRSYLDPELESVFNEPTNRSFQANDDISLEKFWEELFPATKTIIMYELEDCINKI